MYTMRKEVSIMIPKELKYGLSSMVMYTFGALSEHFYMTQDWLALICCVYVAIVTAIIPICADAEYES